MSDRAITESIRKMVGLHKLDPVFYANAEVTSVDIATRSCSCKIIDGQTAWDLPTVKLMPVIDDGILFEPVIGSTVKVIFSEQTEPFVCQYSEIENITMDAKTLLKFNDGSFGGLVKVSDLVERLNAIEKDLNDLKTAISGWTPVPTDGGAALKVATSKWQTSRLTKTKVSDIENKTIVHGK